MSQTGKCLVCDKKNQETQIFCFESDFINGLPYIELCDYCDCKINLKRNTSLVEIEVKHKGKSKFKKVDYDYIKHFEFYDEDKERKIETVRFTEKKTGIVTDLDLEYDDIPDFVDDCWDELFPYKPNKKLISCMKRKLADDNRIIELLEKLVEKNK